MTGRCTSAPPTGQYSGQALQGDRRRSKGGGIARFSAAQLAVLVVATFPQQVCGSGTAILRIDSSGGGSIGNGKSFPAIPAEWTELDNRVSDLPVVKAEADPYGCSKQPRCNGCALLVLQGNCTFAKKAARAEAAGAKLLIVVSATEGPPVGMAAGLKSTTRTAQGPRITAVMVSKKTGRQVILAASRGELLSASCWKHDSPYGDVISEVFFGLLAVALVMLGAWFATEDLRHPEQDQAKFNEEVFAVEEHSGPHFVFFGSVMLTVLFFFMKYLIYLLLFLFASGAVSTTALLLEPLIFKLSPNLRTRKACSIPTRIANLLGLQEDHSCADLIAECVGGALAVAFLIYRNNEAFGWILQDAIAIMLLLTIQRSLRLPNLKVGTLLLVCTFFFDIFWVFLSPLIFQKSVMIEVATGGGTGQSVPMVLKLPTLGGIPGQFKILGLGDIAIPGLLISFLLRHDLVSQTKRCQGYFTAGVIGYGLGLCATFVSLYLMQHGQPALLFLVPGTLVPTFLIAWRKGELHTLWTIDYSPPHAPEGYEELPDAADKHPEPKGGWEEVVIATTAAP
eukprot:CAMPEP_0170594560 /NCGR_PEP_ID=MMETSP0224-20130122/14067_1 /TAXON_ID=285029 /ORGANISM="Togula jolla, Strain CCCM 725" /LENGTH=565 /DNA_ID=CAMNT_0010918629 /DNA_START=73 /DNA_END=1768 /DNA_ORIENTATION=+